VPRRLLRFPDGLHPPRICSDPPAGLSSCPLADCESMGRSAFRSTCLPKGDGSKRTVRFHGVAADTGLSWGHAILLRELKVLTPKDTDCLEKRCEEHWQLPDTGTADPSRRNLCIPSLLSRISTSGTVRQRCAGGASGIPAPDPPPPELRPLPLPYQRT
jgi:hypothetical protein